MAQDSHGVEGTDTETPLESKIKGRNTVCHFARRESKLMLAWTKVIDNYMTYFVPAARRRWLTDKYMKLKELIQ